jgi:long-chain acyl-CoA synthetase
MLTRRASRLARCARVALAPLAQPTAIKALGKQLGVEGDLAALCANAAVNKAVLADLHGVCKRAKLVGFETPAKLLLVPDEWTPENDMLTTTMKIKRKQITDKYAAEIKKIYA